MLWDLDCGGVLHAIVYISRLISLWGRTLYCEPLAAMSCMQYRVVYLINLLRHISLLSSSLALQWRCRGKPAMYTMGFPAHVCVLLSSRIHPSLRANCRSHSSALSSPLHAYVPFPAIL